MSPAHPLSEAYPNAGEQTWSQGEYVEPEVIQQAFGLEKPLTEPSGVYLNQPNPYRQKARELRWVVPFLILVLLAVQLLSARRAANQQVVSGAYLYHANTTNAVAVTAPFELAGRNQALDFALHAPVDNNWLELGIDLVNADTQQAVASFEQSVEYYHGYDDGYWSEGGQTRHHLVPAVPPGKYRLALEASADPAIAEMPFTVTVVRDVMVWSNFWIALALLLLYPDLLLAARVQFRARPLDGQRLLTVFQIRKRRLMKIRNPIYLSVALALTVYVALANHNGWSLVQSVASRTWQRLGPSTQHK